MIEWLKKHKGKITAILAAIFALAAALNSNLLTPEQREAILAFVRTILEVVTI